MDIQPALTQLFAVCALSAAVVSLAGERASGVQAACGLSVALTVLRLALSALR